MEKYLVEFKQDGENFKEIGRYKTIKEANKGIYKFLKEINFKSYFQRVREMDKKIWMDYGSHINFIYISRLDGEKLTMKEYNEEEGEKLKND